MIIKIIKIYKIHKIIKIQQSTWKYTSTDDVQKYGRKTI